MQFHIIVIYICLADVFNIFHYSFKKLGHENPSFVENFIVKINDELNDQLDDVVIDTTGADILEQLKQERQSDAFEGRL